MNFNQNENQRRAKKARENVGIFLGLTVAMLATAVFMTFVTWVSSPGTILSASLAGLFTGLMLAYRTRVGRLEATVQ